MNYGWIFLFIAMALLPAPTSQAGTGLPWSALARLGCRYVFHLQLYPADSVGKESIPAPVTAEIDLTPLADPFYHKLALDRAGLWRKTNDGKLTPVPFSLEKQTQYRCRVKWNTRTDDRSTYYFGIPTVNPTVPEKPRLDMPLFMDGGMLRVPGLHRFSGVFLPSFCDFNRDGKMDLITGGLHDFIRIYENIAPRPEDTPLFSENHAYVLADRTGKEICHDRFNHCWMVSSPTFWDINRDGKTDLIWGGTLGNTDVWYLENVGSTESPEYIKKQHLDLKCADGYKRGLYPVPCDLNGDGRIDLVAGSLTPGGGDERFVYYFEGLSQPGEALRFKDGIRLQDCNGVIRVPGYSQCTVAVRDWDGDGLPDLFVTSEGKLLYWKNQGTKTAPRLVRQTPPTIALASRSSLTFVPGPNGPDILSGMTAVLNRNDGKGGLKPEPLMLATPAPVIFSGHNTFRVMDWNGDGHKEVVYSTDWGKAMLASNAGGQWNRRQPLKAAGQPISSWGCVDPGELNKGYLRMAVGDLNGDGHPDLVVNHELSWRFGAPSVYWNLGNGEFAAEERLNLPRQTKMSFRPGENGSAAVFDANTIRDYWSYPAAEIFDPAGGEITIQIAVAHDFPAKQPMNLLHNQDFRLDANRLMLLDEFAVDILANGALQWRAGKSTLVSPALKWQPGKWYKLVFQWGQRGMTIRRDGEIAASGSDASFQEKAGPRFYVGCRQSIDFVEKKRENKARISYHIREYRNYFPFEGNIDNLTIRDRSGREIFQLSCDGTPDGLATLSGKTVSGGSVNLAYRSAPAIADLDSDGLPDLVLAIAVGPNSRERNPAQLYWFKNCGTKTSPRFAAGQALTTADGVGVIAGTRSSVRFADWNGDGRLDLFLMQSGGLAQYYANIGSATAPNFEFCGTLVDQSWGHESGIDLVDWDGDGRPELLLMNGDEGNLLFYNQAYLKKLIPQCVVKELLTEKKTIALAEHRSPQPPLPLKTVRSNLAGDYLVRNLCDGNREGSTGWWIKQFPGEAIFEFGQEVTVARIEGYFGSPSHASRPSGDRCPKSYRFDYWNGQGWEVLFPQVENGPDGQGQGVGRTTNFTFPPRKTDKIRMTIYSSYDTGRRIGGKAAPSDQAAFIREIVFYEK